METKNNNEIIDRKLCIFICYSFLLVAINRVVTLPIFDSFQSIIAMLQWAILIVLFIPCVRYIYIRHSHVFIGSYSFFFFLYLFSIFLNIFANNPINLLVTHDALWTFCFFLPVGLASFAIQDYKLLYVFFSKWSIVITLCCTIYLVYRVFINPFGNSYDMAFGYILLLPTLFHFSLFKRGKNLGWLILSVVETLMLLLFGSRGVLIGIMCFWFLYPFLKSSSKYAKYHLMLTISGLFLVYTQLPAINDYLEEYNIYSRTLYKIATGEEDDDSYGRTHHWEVGMDLVADNPIVGYGLGGYYYDFHKRIANKYPDELYAFDPEQGVWVKAGVSVSGTHSGFIEMMLFFGPMIGIPLAVWFLFSIFKVKNIDDEYLFELLLIFYCCNIISNMIVGGGIFTKPGCGIYIFLLLSQRFKQRIPIFQKHIHQ